MKPSEKLHLFVGAAVYLLCGTSEALAWGPGTHVQLAFDVLSELPALPAALAALITKYTMDFLYGNLAADVIFARRFCEAKKHCHHWHNGFNLLERALDERGRAFAWGYLSHLAADVVAHNKFVPRQITVSRTSLHFGHLYWEMRADSLVDPCAWPELRRILRGHFVQHDELMDGELEKVLFSFETNRRIFTRTNLLTSARAWQRGVRLWTRVSRWPLSPSMLRHYNGECLDRIMSVLQEGPNSAVLHEDPVGSASFSHLRLQRRQLRQMARAGILDRYVLEEATAVLDPQSWTSDEDLT